MDVISPFLTKFLFYILFVITSNSLENEDEIILWNTPDCRVGPRAFKTQDKCILYRQPSHSQASALASFHTSHLRSQAFTERSFTIIASF